MTVEPPFGLPSVTVRLVRKRFRLQWPWTWWRRRRLKRELERQLQRRADELRDEVYLRLRDGGYI